jgi:hypothetical protein
MDDGVDRKAVTCCVTANEIELSESVYSFVEKHFILCKLGHLVAFGIIIRSSPFIESFRALKITLTLGKPGFTFPGPIE